MRWFVCNVDDDSDLYDPEDDPADNVDINDYT